MHQVNNLLRECVQLLLLLLVVMDISAANAQTKSRVFTVSDDIGLAYFGDIVKFSPDDQLFVAETNRGRIDLKSPESSLCIYRAGDVENYLARPEPTGELVPLWTVSKSTYKYGPIITKVRWLRDSSGIAFLAKSDSGSDQLFLADIRSRKVLALTPESEHVTAFDIRSEKVFVYTVLSGAIHEKAVQDQRAPSTVGTGQSLESLLFPNNAPQNIFIHDLSELWAVVNGKRFRVMDPETHRPIPIHLPGQLALALSPDGRSVITALTVKDVPAQWEKLYPPESPSSGERIIAGHQDPYTLTSPYAVSEFVLLDLRTGKSTSLVQAPLGFAVGWLGASHADWSDDGKSVVLSSTFLPPGEAGMLQPHPPCIAVGDPMTRLFNCVRDPDSTEGTISSGKEIYIGNAYFLHGNKDVVVDPYWDEEESDQPILKTYVRQADSSWKVEGRGQDLSEADRSIVITVKESVNDPPVLVAMDKRTKVSRTIWDPNPQLKEIKLGRVSVIEWKDNAGRQWKGGLYKPPDFLPGKRYPLVIQTHGFSGQNFHADGLYPTVFAAQELAGVGFLVLQMIEDCPGLRDREGPCQVEGFESAVEKLTSDGLVDPDRVGLIGFSRTCFHVLEALTSSKFRFKAALIADGVNFSYLQYMTWVDFSTNYVSRKTEAIIGAAPFGDGLKLWLSRAPGFNMDKVITPVEVVATRLAFGPLVMWEPYAALRRLHKPVDLLVLNTEEHVFTNPEQRLISQGTSIDWFRFWMQDYEDPEPAKRDQYARWRELRKLQEQNDRQSQQPSPPSAR